MKFLRRNCKPAYPSNFQAANIRLLFHSASNSKPKKKILFIELVFQKNMYLCKLKKLKTFHYEKAWYFIHYGAVNRYFTLLRRLQGAGP